MLQQTVSPASADHVFLSKVRFCSGMPLSSMCRGLQGKLAFAPAPSDRPGESKAVLLPRTGLGVGL